MITINMSEWPEECPLCGEWSMLRYSVAYYEEPRPDLEIGDRMSDDPDDRVGGMICCRQCHDTLYGIESPHAVLARQQGQMELSL